MAVRMVPLRALARRRCEVGQRRWFLTSLTDLHKPQHLLATKTLPYSQEDLFRVIADIDAYRSFVPFCTLSQTTKTAHGFPSEANLRVGFKGFEETFVSSVACRPHSSVMADASGKTPFTLLTVKWELGSQHARETQVRLEIGFQFDNPMYAGLGGAFAPKLAPLMMDAFEKRADDVLSKTKPAAS